MPAPREIIELIERFERNRDTYRSNEYNETETRREFIDPFFKALGWDIDNEQGYAEAYKDVVHEDAIKIGGATKAPDYAFRSMRSLFHLHRIQSPSGRVAEFVLHYTAYGIISAAVVSCHTAEEVVGT